VTVATVSGLSSQVNLVILDGAHDFRSTFVQHWVEDAPKDPSDAYKAVACQACTQLHFINISNGRLLGETEK
jgi:hypothetical protein